MMREPINWWHAIIASLLAGGFGYLVLMFGCSRWSCQ